LRCDARLAYVLKVYPRYSETFILNELLAHERAGVRLEIFSLRAPGDGRFHEAIGQVRAPISYVPSGGLGAERLWAGLQETARELPATWAALAEPAGADARDAVQALWLAREVRRRGITHLHAHFASAPGRVARLAARIAGVTYSVTAHAKDIFHESVDPGSLGPLLEDATAAVTVSDFNLAHLRALAPGARVERVYNGIDLERYPYADPAVRKPRVLAVGRLIEKKGFGDLVDACARLAAAGRSVRCDIIGEGELRDRLAARIAEHGLTGDVRLLGQRTQDEVRAAIADSAVLAAPCVVAADGNRDGLPTVLLEAMALGTPCVSTPVTGIPEAIEHERTGLLVQEAEPASLAAALARLLDDTRLRSRLAAGARARVAEDFELDRSAARLRAVAWVGAPAHAGVAAAPPPGRVDVVRRTGPDARATSDTHPLR
jgi:colanic acid/amylovoran biosynthesis glycosyltransferase